LPLPPYVICCYHEEGRQAEAVAVQTVAVVAVAMHKDAVPEDIDFHYCYFQDMDGADADTDRLPCDAVANRTVLEEAPVVDVDFQMLPLHCYYYWHYPYSNWDREKHTYPVDDDIRAYDDDNAEGNRRGATRKRWVVHRYGSLETEQLYWCSLHDVVVLD
jgi:hypothetical protein